MAVMWHSAPRTSVPGEHLRTWISYAPAARTLGEPVKAARSRLATTRYLGQPYRGDTFDAENGTKDLFDVVPGISLAVIKDSAPAGPGSSHRNVACLLRSVFSGRFSGARRSRAGYRRNRLPRDCRARPQLSAVATYGLAEGRKLGISGASLRDKRRISAHCRLRAASLVNAPASLITVRGTFL
jgi:hypothetical protein